MRKALKYTAIGLAIYVGIVAYTYTAANFVWPGVGVLMILGPFIGVIAYSFVKKPQ